MHLSWGIVCGGVKREKRIMGGEERGDFLRFFKIGKEIL